MKRVVVSAPGKVYLMGDHTIVYGRPALLSAVNLRLTVTVQETKKSKEEIVAGEFTQHILRALPLIQKELSNQLKPFRLTLASDIPLGYHLGSSAAVAVVVSGALMKWYTGEFDKERINTISYEVEKLAHGNPSGGDNTTVTYGGFILYRKKSETEKVFQRMSLTLSKNLNHFFLINTGKPKENTGEMVALVRKKYDKNPEKFHALFDTNEKQVERIIDALNSGDEKTLINAIQIGQGTLEKMGVVSEKVKPLIRAIEKSGGAAKILGGGGITEGVGFLLCFHRDKKSVETIASKFHYPLQSITLGEEGVRTESISN